VAALPSIFVAAGVVLSLAAGVVAWQLVRSRRAAERDAGIITELYDRLDDRYVEQRSIAETLQRALLPLTNPAIANLDIATRYVAGADGVDVGGDWYSAIALEDDRHFAFVVGDVSGRGVEAATIMARLRFTLRAYLLEGHPPDTALEMCAKHIQIGVDRHFATVLVGRGDLLTRTVVLANAGHLKPLVIDDGQAHYVETPVGRPLGLGPCTYATTTITMNPGATLVAFTDGLVERRGEDLLVSMEHLAETALAAEPLAASGEGIDVESLLTQLVTTMTPEGPTDDIAILALRWHRTTELQRVAQSEPAGDSARSTLIPDAIS
jgi:serine phosphatase RsbU (regulator of sigma subunit)